MAIIFPKNKKGVFPTPYILAILVILDHCQILVNGLRVFLTDSHSPRHGIGKGRFEITNFDEHIRIITPDRAGDLWMGTRSGKVIRHDGQKIVSTIETNSGTIKTTGATTISDINKLNKLRFKGKSMRAKA